MKVIITELNWMEGMTMLRERGMDVLYDPELWKDRERLEKEIEDAEILIVRNQSKVDRTLLQKGKDLKIVGRLGVGLDNIDLNAAQENNIEVITAKNANATSVAEYIVSTLFHITRPITAAAEDVKSGNWDRKRFTRGELYGKTIGLVGAGETGLRVASRANTLGMNVIAYDPFVKPYDFAVMEADIQMMGLNEVMAQSDFISIHVPLTEETKYLIDENKLRKMKQNSWIINSSRGGVIKEADLYDVLEGKYIGGAVLDVIENEPVSMDDPLLKLDNCLITPHIAGLTDESQNRTSVFIAEEILKKLK